MARSRKDGRRSGAHRHGHEGREYWSSRPTKYPMADAGKGGNAAAKRDTHRAERRAAKAECEAE